MKQGTVYLVGAGCGAADLITVRGQRLLATCDAVVYDDLIAQELLALTPPAAQRIYMGKRSGHHSASQREICETLIRLARTGKTVVRLKGGDPYVFGRGGEEMLALLDAGISCEVVPGVTSAIAIAAEAGIPVTHRGRSRSVHIVTAHTADTPDGLPEDLEQLAQLHGTLVFLMGLRQLPKIAERLIRAGMDPKTPAAVLSGGNAPHPARVCAPLEDLPKRAEHVQPPAVIVIGSITEMNLRARRPLDEITVAVTGTDAILEKLEDPLRSLGAKVFRAQYSKVVQLSTSWDLNDQEVHWLVFTSANGVDAFFANLREREFDLRRLHSCRFAVIGPGTGKKLASYGIRPDLCPEIFTVEALGQALLKAVRPGTPVFLLRSAKGDALLRQMLTAHFEVKEISLYDLKNDEDTGNRAADKLPYADYITFSSASGVEFFFKNHSMIPEGAVPVCIGPVSAARLRCFYDGPILISESATAKSMVDTMIADAKNKKVGG